MPYKPFFPFNQDHPTFPAEFRSPQKDFSSRNATRGAHPVLQDERMNFSFIFEKGCRIAFSGFFRHGSKDFCLVENMNPNLLKEIFFEIKHSSNPSEHADITAAVLGIRDATKFFFVSCDYLDPEHIIVRTYAKLRDFDWNEQSQIDDLNLFRMAAIVEGCGIIAFAEDNTILPLSEMRSRIEVIPNNSEAQSHVLASQPVPPEAQDLQAHPSAPKFQFRSAAPPFQPVTSIVQVNDRQLQFHAESLERDRVWGALGVSQGLQSLIQPVGHVPHPSIQSNRSHETLHQFNQRQVGNQGQNPRSGMQQQLERAVSSLLSHQGIMTQFQRQLFEMRQLPIHHGNDTSYAQGFEMLPQQTQQTYGHIPQYTTSQNYTPPLDRRYNLLHQHHQQGLNQQHGQGQQNVEQLQVHGPHAPRQHIQGNHNNIQNVVALQQNTQQNPVPLQTERYGGPQQALQGYYQYENLTAADFQQYEQNGDNNQDLTSQNVQSAPEQNDLDPPSESKY
ncbi:hypothetical protein BPOR_0065g00030 [Botrytis porri]|uniref:Uncharacterized protein n=1 Tax=Botrytis porri TaxID=87229 RepID=A0A4Z1L0S0_9HELO|nr:hypothetical protein BPOR_0065g00030 [Botrytis porri]